MDARPCRPAARLRAVAATAMLACAATPALADEAAALGGEADAVLNAVRSRIVACDGSPRMTAAVGRSDAPLAAERPALRWSPRLAQAAARHAGSMARSRVFDHVGSDGSTVRERVSATGYRWALIGENLAAGHADLTDAIDGWLASPSHCEALLDPRFTEFGLARTVSDSPNDAYGVYWTLVLGRPR